MEWVRGVLTELDTLRSALDGGGSVFLVWPGLATEHAEQVARLLAGRVRHVVYLFSAGIDDAQDGQADPINRMHA